MNCCSQKQNNNMKYRNNTLFKKVFTKSFVICLIRRYSVKSILLSLIVKYIGV